MSIKYYFNIKANKNISKRFNLKNLCINGFTEEKIDILNELNFLFTIIYVNMKKYSPTYTSKQSTVDQKKYIYS